MYSNDRIVSTATSCAKNGEVSLSLTKVVWMGTMFVVSIVGGYLTFSTSALLAFVICTLVSLCLGHSLGMHRRLIHNSYQCPLWLEYVFVHLGVIVGLAGPIGMIKTHDLRDWAQRQIKCHDYFGHKSGMLQDFYWQMFCDIKLANPPSFAIEKRVSNNDVFQFMEQTWMLQQLPLAVILFALGGIPFVVWGICVRVSISVIGHWLIGYFAHNHGQRSWHVDKAHIQGFNVPFAAFLTMGESYHNNHHAFPGSAKFALEPGQVDIGWLVLLQLNKWGLVWGLKSPQDLPERKELISLNSN